jgi:hypothetical protein
MSNGSDVQMLDSDPRRRGLAFLPGVGTRRGRTDIQLLLTIEADHHKAADTSFHDGTV